MTVTHTKTMLAIAGLLLLAAGFDAPAFSADKASLRLNWTVIGEHVPYYYAFERGFYAQENIDLTIGEGTGAGNTVQLVGNKSDTFGIGDAGSLMLAAGKGLPVIMVASVMNQSPFAIISLQELGITKPKDLEGKRIAATAGDALTQVLPALLKLNNVDQTKVTYIYMDPAAKIPAVMQRRTDVLIGGTTAQAVQIEGLGAKINVIKFADHGANTVGQSLLTHTDLVKENPDLVARMIRATLRGFHEALKPQNEEAAIAATAKAKVGADPKVLRRQWEETKKLIFSTKAENKIIGWASRADWEDTLALMKEYRGLVTDKPATAFYTNQFIPRP